MSKRILIIDDDEEDREIITFSLNENGIKDIIYASTGEEGIQLAKEHKPDVILLDTQLPGMNGFETCQKIKYKENIETKVIILTGVVDVVDAGKAREMGADDYCVKTSDYEPMLEKIKKYI